MSKIEWTGKTWNPVVGCDKISAGCKNCYAINMANRLQGIPATKEKYAGTVKKTAGGLNWTGRINTDEKSLLIPLQTKKPTTWFVNSMSDLFHESVPFEFIDMIFCVMKATPQHTYQILTKRADIMQQYMSDKRRPHKLDSQYLKMMDHIYRLPSKMCYVQPGPSVVGWPLPNVWVGVSVEDQKAADERIPSLCIIPAAVKWLSMEPLLGPIDISRFLPQWGGAPLYVFDDDSMAEPIDWVVTGGESGHNARPMLQDWARSIRDQCKSANVPFFFKQWGEWAPPEYAPEELVRVGKKNGGRLLDGVEHNEYPV